MWDNLNGNVTSRDQEREREREREREKETWQIGILWPRETEDVNVGRIN